MAYPYSLRDLLNTFQEVYTSDLKVSAIINSTPIIFIFTSGFLIFTCNKI